MRNILTIAPLAAAFVVVLAVFVLLPALFELVAIEAVAS